MPKSIYIMKRKKHYLEIIIPRYDVPISLRGKYYIRTGSTLQELNGPALNEFVLKPVILIHGVAEQ